MPVDSKGLTIYRLLPQEVENYLSEKYGNRLIAVNSVKLAKQNETRVNHGYDLRESSY